MSRRFDRFTLWIVDCPLIVLIGLALISAVAVVGYRDPSLISDWFPASAPGGAEQQDSAADVGTDESVIPPPVEAFRITDADAILVVESDSLFTPTGAQAMRRVVDALEQLEFVDRVIWMDHVPGLNIFGLPEPILPNSKATEQRFLVAKEKALDHPFVGGQLLSRDGRTTLLLIHFDYFYVTSDEDCTAGVKQTAVDTARLFPQFDVQFTVTGRVPIFLTAMDAHETNQFKYQIIGYGIIAILSIVLFRGVVAIAIVGLAPALGVFWTLGIIRIFDFQDNPFNDVVLPVMISLVGFTDGVHLMVQIRRLRSEGLPPRDAAREGIRKVGLACGLTSLTTGIGFGSLTLAHHEIVQEFGWCCVIGVTLSFIAVVTAIPLACSTVLGKRVQVGHAKGLIDRNLERIGLVVDFVLRHVGKVSLAGIVTTLVLIAITATLRPDERRESVLPTRSEAAVGLRKMDRALGGLEWGHVQIRWTPDVASDDPLVMKVIREIDDWLRDEALIGNPISIRNLVDALPGQGLAEDRMSMLDLLPPPIKRAYYEPERRVATVSFRVQDLGIATYGPVFERLTQQIENLEVAYPFFQIELQGSAVWRWQNLYQIVVDLMTSLGTASVVIFLVLTLVYRSLRIGLISIIPNIFPLAVAGTYLALSGMSLEIVSVCAFTVCLGIAVDDTIHFITRYKEELDEVADERLAIRRAFTSVGTALVMTTLVLVSGFMSVLFSDSRDHQIFARMGAITVTAALFGDMVFLPAILARFPKRSNTKWSAHK